MFIATTATSKLLGLNKRIRIVSGGTSASKTISILMILIDYAQSHKNELISVVSESFPHLKRGAIRDFLNIMEGQNYFKDDLWNRTDYTYNFESGSKIEFFSADQPGKVRGPRRDVLFVNEGNNIQYETFTQLEIRTRKIIWVDHNPVSEYWAYTDVMKHTDCDFVTLTYKDNEALSPDIIKSIEDRKYNKMWYQVYALGQLGEIEGRIYTGWGVIDDIPESAKFKNFGLDFGYTNDPTAIVATYKLNDTIILDEICYRKGMLNGDIYQIMKDRDGLIIADSASPKDIAELNLLGLTVQSAIKGRDSIKYGIGVVQSKKIMVTKRSTNLLKEYRNYLWEKDANDKNVNIPQDFDNHLLDALRYSLTKLYNDEIPIIPNPPQFSGQAILDQLMEGEDDLYNR